MLFEENWLIVHERNSIICRQLCSEFARPGYKKVAQNVLQPRVVLLTIYHAIL